MGRGSEVGAVLLEDERIAGVSFTGSVGTGQRVAAACVGRGAKVQLEMGGKNPFVVLDDADLNVAVGAAINSGFFLYRPALHRQQPRDRDRRHPRPLRGRDD